jgi:hypothetical protein
MSAPDDLVSITVAAAVIFGWRSWTFIVVELLAIAAMYGLDRVAMPIVDRWDRGAEGEEPVAKIDPAMLRQAYAERKALERLTGMQADALLVFSRAYLVPAVRRQRGVLVLPARMLLGHLERRQPKLDPAEVNRVHSQLVAALDG